MAVGLTSLPSLLCFFFFFFFGSILPCFLLLGLSHVRYPYDFSYLLIGIGVGYGYGYGYGLVWFSCLKFSFLFSFSDAFSHGVTSACLSSLDRVLSVNPNSKLSSVICPA